LNSKACGLLLPLSPDRDTDCPSQYEPVGM
jgi:hypothetical protein